jgi:plastocyanin
MFEKRAALRLTGLLFAGALAACGGGGDAGTGGEAATPAAGAAAPAVVANAGTITGVVNFAGTAPANEKIDMSEEPTCAAKHPTGPTKETVIANNGKLKNVFVYIKEGLTGTYPAPSTPVEIDQIGCVYTPHVTGVTVGQGLVFKNTDGLAHNIKATPTANRSFNISQPNNMTSAPQMFSTAEIMVPVQCDIHGWMQAYVGVVANPYFAVSGDDGSFSIGNVPPGTYTLEAWHEKYGVKTGQVTVDPNGTATVTFDYSAAVANATVPLGRPIDPHGTHVAAATPATH